MSHVDLMYCFFKIRTFHYATQFVTDKHIGIITICHKTLQVSPNLSTYETSICPRTIKYRYSAQFNGYLC